MFQILGRRADSLRMGLYTNFLDTTPARLSHISFHAQFRSERSDARMFEHGMICVRDGREGYERPRENV